MKFFGILVFVFVASSQPASAASQLTSIGEAFRTCDNNKIERYFTHVSTKIDQPVPISNDIYQYPIILASECSDDMPLQFFMARDAKLNVVGLHGGSTILMILATLPGKERATKEILERDRTLVESRDDKGRTAYMYAASSRLLGQVAVLESFMTAHQILNERKRALELLAKKQDFEFKEELEKYYAQNIVVAESPVEISPFQGESAHNLVQSIREAVEHTNTSNTLRTDPESSH